MLQMLCYCDARIEVDYFDTARSFYSPLCTPCWCNTVVSTQQGALSTVYIFGRCILCLRLQVHRSVNDIYFGAQSMQTIPALGDFEPQCTGRPRRVCSRQTIPEDVLFGILEPFRAQYLGTREVRLWLRAPWAPGPCWARMTVEFKMGRNDARYPCLVCLLAGCFDFHFWEHWG